MPFPVPTVPSFVVGVANRGDVSSVRCGIALFSEGRKDQIGYGASLEVLEKTGIYFPLFF